MLINVNKEKSTIRKMSCVLEKLLPEITVSKNPNTKQLLVGVRATMIMFKINDILSSSLMVTVFDNHLDLYFKQRLVEFTITYSLTPQDRDMFLDFNDDDDEVHQHYNRQLHCSS